MVKRVILSRDESGLLSSVQCLSDIYSGSGGFRELNTVQRGSYLGVKTIMIGISMRQNFGARHSRCGDGHETTECAQNLVISGIVRYLVALSSIQGRLSVVNQTLTHCVNISDDSSHS